MINTKENQEITIENGVKILSLKANEIVREMEKNGKYSLTYKDKEGNIKNRSYKKLYKGMLAYSLDLIKLYELKPKAFKLYNETDKNLTTNLIVSVNFKKELLEYSKDDIQYTYDSKKEECKKREYRINGVKKNKAELRNQLYTDGFVIDGVKYVFFKRSSSSARESDTLFIDEKYYKDMMKWSHFDIDFSKHGEFDFASLKAYESLTLSGIEGLITIDPNSILLINDKKTKCNAPASVTRLDVNGIPEVTNEDHFKHESNIWDGQSLIDESIVPDHNKSMWQLRQRFFKTAAFSCKLQQYFRDRCREEGRDYDIATTFDMFGREMLLKDIKLITTPSSLKFLKFSKYASDIKDEHKQKRDAYLFWLKKVSSSFGLCKNEKETVYGTARALSYQMINSLDLSEQEIRELLKEEFEYIRLLKTGSTVFRWHCNLYDPSPSESFVSHLIAHCQDADKTRLYAGFLNDKTNDYKDLLYQGKVKLTNTDYSVLVGNPIEMLAAAYGDEINQSIHKRKYDVWCNRYEDGQELFGARNPHICAGNVLLARNVWHDEFKYINLTGNIVIINNYESDIQNKLQGADQDSDTVLLSSNPILVAKAREAQKFPIPVKDIDLLPTPREFNNAQSAAIDDVIANNKIGTIIDRSQILNSHYWNCRSKGATEAELQEIYDKISMLSSLSQLELDKCKKYYDEETVKIKDALAAIYDMQWRGGFLIKSMYKPRSKEVDEETKETIEKYKQEKDAGALSQEMYDNIVDGLTIEYKEKKRIKPKFFSKMKKNKKVDKKYFETLYCPMDILVEYIEKARDRYNKPNKEDKIPISDILVEIKGHKDDRRQIKILYGFVYKAKKEIDQLRQDEEMNGAERAKKIRQILDELTEEFKKKKISIETVSAIIKKSYEDEDRKPEDRKNKTVPAIVDGKEIQIKVSKYRLRMMGALWASHPEKVKACFKLCNGNQPMPRLIKSEDGDITIWGERYKKILVPVE